MNITKEEFVKTINKLETASDSEWNIWMALKDNGVWVDDERDGLENSVIELLSYLVNPIRPDLAKEDIEYFVYELDFGREFEIGNIMDKDGNPIDFSSAEKLYDYFVEEEKYYQKLS